MNKEKFEEWTREFYSNLACASDTWPDEKCTYSDFAHHMAWRLWCDMQSRLESLEKDAARMDWMDKVGWVRIERVREGHVNGPLRWDVEYGHYDDCAKSKKSMRDAIDEAMKG